MLRWPQSSSVAAASTTGALAVARTALRVPAGALAAGAPGGSGGLPPRAYFASRIARMASTLLMPDNLVASPDRTAWPSTRSGQRQEQLLQLGPVDAVLVTGADALLETGGDDGEAGLVQGPGDR